jgi:hypothetical protein
LRYDVLSDPVLLLAVRRAMVMTSYFIAARAPWCRRHA